MTAVAVTVIIGRLCLPVPAGIAMACARLGTVAVPVSSAVSTAVSTAVSSHFDIPTVSNNWLGQEALFRCYFFARHCNGSTRDHETLDVEAS